MLAGTGVMILLILCLLSATAAYASFERPLFPLHNPSIPSSHPARLASAMRPCGGVGMDRPFGLSQLAAHRVQAVIPVGDSVIGGGFGLRGPARHREHGLWLATARRVGKVRAGLAIQRLSWRGALSGQTALSYVIGVGAALPMSWFVEFALRPSSQVAPKRLGLTLRREAADGSVAATLQQRAPRGGMVRWTALTQIDRLHLLGEVSGLMRRTSVGVGWHGTPSVLLHSETHAVLGRSTSAWVGRLCR